MDRVSIGGRVIGPDRPTFIIAEAGTGFAHIDPRERLRLACAAALNASLAGAEAIKFQMFVPDEPLFCPMDGDDERWERWQKTYLSYKDWCLVKDYAEGQCGLTFLASAFQRTAVDWLRDMGVKAYKVASRAARTFPYDVAPGPFFISVPGEVNPPFVVSGGKMFICLHCIPQYPVQLKNARMLEGGNGLSDHSGTVWPGLDAMARGASILEVHFTVPGLDPGPDAPVCLDFEQLKFLCEARDGIAAMS